MIRRFNRNSYLDRTLILHSRRSENLAPGNTAEQRKRHTRVAAIVFRDRADATSRGSSASDRLVSSPAKKV